MIIAGICIHLIFLLSIFDIYFKSPIVDGISEFYPKHEPPAKRLVLFVIDGLRAESFIEHEYMPYSRSIALKKGRWGISRTRVPTESRPGHVALIAGFYEDPSAVLRGWKKNPVDFDSIFNESKYTWAWGADDILSIFSKAGSDEHIFLDPYNTSDQAFSTDTNTTLLDKWVFHKVETFLKTAKSDNDLKSMVSNCKIVLFLHLLGTDTSGHTHKPNNVDFVTNLRHVDEGVKQMEELINNFFQDNETIFLLTSDHGMTDWGSHGTGDTHETDTPYVLWGSGVYRSSSKDTELEHGLPKLHRLDIEQADLCPLMSTTIGIPVPVNSVGILPDKLLHMSLPNRAKAIYSNARQLAAQYDRKRMLVEANAISCIYYPFEPLNKKIYSEIIGYSEKLLADGEYQKLMILSEELIRLSLSGLDYYHNYYQSILLALISLSFLGWSCFLLTSLLEQRRSTDTEVSMEHFKAKKYNPMNLKRILNLIFAVSSATFVILVCVQKLPFQYYIYCLLPIVLWWKVVSSLHVWSSVLKQINQQRMKSSILMQVTLYVSGCTAIVWSFSHRWLLSAPLIGMGLWPLASRRRNQLPKNLLLFWTLSCFLLGLFSFLPVVGKKTDVELVIAAGTLWMIIFIVIFKTLKNNVNEPMKRDLSVMVTQTVMLLLALTNIYKQSVRFRDSTPVVSTDQVIAWSLLLASLVLPLMSSTDKKMRLFSIYTSLLTIYLLLSVSHEGLFLVTLMLNLFTWVVLELKISHSESKKFSEGDISPYALEKVYGHLDIERSLTENDFRRGFFFLLYIILSFFGTGNIASLNSFEVRWVTCFVTSFRPFFITGLILLKTMVPFLCVGCAFRLISLNSKAPTGYMLIIVLNFTNIMGVQFLYFVRNTGSWLEIGTSISQYVIAQLITLFVVILHNFAKLLTECNMYDSITKAFEIRKKYV